MSTKSAPKPTYAVGYGKPPVHSKFQPGQSGNPRGREKGSRNILTELHALLDKTLVVQVDGKKQRMPARRAIGLRLLDKTVKGDLRAMALFMQLIQRHEDQMPTAKPNAPLPKEDLEVIHAFLAKHGISPEDTQEPPADTATKAQPK